MAVLLILITIGIINIQCGNTRSINQDLNFTRRNKTLKSIPNVAFQFVGPHCENKTVLETKKIPGSAATPLNQGISSTCTCHALSNAIADQLYEESQIDIDPTRLADIIVSYNKHVGAVWPDEYDNYFNPLITMDKKTARWISIKIKTVKRVAKFINTERHVLSYYTTVVGGTWTNNHCVFVRQQSGDLYDCVNSWGDYDIYPTVPVNRPGNILWTVRVEWNFAEKCKDAAVAESRQSQGFKEINQGQVEHQGVRGYHTFAHVRNADRTFKNITNIHGEMKNRMVRVKLPTYEDEKLLSEVKENLCGDYFKRYFEIQAKEKPVVLPQVVPNGINNFVDTMERWCTDTNDMFDLKGLVIHSFDVSVYLGQWFHDTFQKERLFKDLDIKEFPSTSIIIVYNPKENVILLIRKSEKKDLRNQIELCSSDIKLFMLLFGEELKRNGVKVISLLARNLEEGETMNCEGCEHSIVSVEILESYELFKVWWDIQVRHYKVKNTGELDKDKTFAFSANVIGLLAAAQFVDNLPSFTEDPSEQMEHVLIMLTPEQREILYSCDKHLLIKGPYGCGKTIIARKKLQMLSEEFAKSKKNGIVHFICYDPRSSLVNEVRVSDNVKVHCNKGGYKLSEIIKDISKEVKNENVGLIIDEYDSENLDKREAESLNTIFEGDFRDAFVYLISQSMEKDREVKKAEKTEKEEKNMFHLLKTMKQVELNLVMRNPTEVSNLIWVTQNFLEEQQTIYQYLRAKEPPNNSSMLNERNIEEKESGHELNQQPRSTSAQFTKSENKFEHEVNIQKQHSVLKIGLDEAFGLAKFPRGSNVDVNKIVNSFSYIPSEFTGHFVKTCNPKLFELVGDNIQDYSFEKLLALNFAFRKLNIVNSNSNNKHVVLHFNTVTDQIPKALEYVFEYLKLSSKVTGSYEDFKFNKNKSILVCSFFSFRGLEHSNITITIDHDIYSLQHYLVEAMARCTNKLALMVLQRSETLSKIIKKWRNGLNGKPLIDLWKVQISQGVKKKFCYQEDEKLRLITINSSSKEHEAMRRKFDQHRLESYNFDTEQTAEELIQKWFHAKDSDGHSMNPWYMQDEIAELTFLRRHKDFIAEIERSSADTWIQNVTFKDFESERDAYLCLSRCSEKLGLVKECHSCNTILAIYRLTYRCLECRDMDICSDCYFRGGKLSGHSTNHRMVSLRIQCDGCNNYLLKTRFRCTKCRDFDLCLDCHQREIFPERHDSSHKMIKTNWLNEQLGIDVFYAVISGNKKLIERLLELGAPPDGLPNYFDGTPLHEAASKNHTFVIQLLLDRGADINARDTNDQTALHKAAWSNCTSAIQLLLERGAHFNAKSIAKETALDLARLQTHKAAIDLLMDFSANVGKA